MEGFTINRYWYCYEGGEFHGSIGAGVAERINRNEIDNLLEIDWNRITDGFRECCLKMLLGLIDTKVARVLAVRSCLAFYEAYLVECRYD